MAGVFLGLLTCLLLRRDRSRAFKTPAPQLTDQVPCGFCDGIADMFRDDNFGSNAGRITFRDIGDDLATCPANGPRERSHETVECAQEIADPVPQL